jgi:multidrug resistance efflux pump
VRDVEKAQNVVDARQGALNAALAHLASVMTQVTVQLPAEKASAEAELAQAHAALAKMTVYAGVDGYVEQFSLRKGDIVNPFMRPAGLLIPTEAGRVALQAGFGQIESQIIKPGMIGEVSCAAIPFTIIPVVVTDVQNVIAAGQFRASDQLIDPMTQSPAPGALTVYLEPLYKGALDRLLPGSSCSANVYTSNHDALQDPGLSSLKRLALHGIDTVGMVHAMILRLQALLMPVRVLVLSGGH